MTEEDGTNDPHGAQDDGAREPLAGSLGSPENDFSHAAEGAFAGHSGGDDEVEIVFYATVNSTPGTREPDEKPAAAEHYPQRLLLPAWSSASTPPLPPPPATIAQSQKGKMPLWRACLFGAIAAAIVLSLLGSSLFSLYWFWQVRSERVAEMEALVREQTADQDASPVEEDEAGAGMGDQPAVIPAGENLSDPVNRIVFINDNQQVETTNPDGSDRRLLTSDARSYLFPAWSADGSTIAAIGTSVSGGGLYVMPDEEGPAGPLELYFSREESPFYLYWSPSGEEISFLANQRGGGLSLNVADADGVDAMRTIALGSPMYWVWTADSQRMLMHRGAGIDESQLVLIDRFGRRQSAEVPNPGPFQAPGISFSDSWWAYSQYRAGGNSWLVAADRLTGTESGNRHAGVVAFSWSPTQDELAFISGGSSGGFAFWGPLRLMDAISGDVRLLSGETVIAFFWSPDGEKIVTISLPSPDDGFGNQFEVRLEKDPRLAKSQPGNVHSFQINVIDVRSGEGLRLLESPLSPLFLAQFLPYFDQYAHSHQIWSPDSSALVLPLAREGGSELAIIDVDSGRMTTLAEGSIGFWSAQ